MQDYSVDVCEFTLLNIRKQRETKNDVINTINNKGKSGGVGGLRVKGGGEGGEIRGGGMGGAWG
jgi:hypothetical protein